MNYVFRFIFVFISLQFYVTLVHSKAGSYILPEAADVIDVTKAPFYADNSGKTDCSTALQKAFTYAATETNGIFTKDKRAVQIIYFPAGTYKVSKPLIFYSKEVQSMQREKAKKEKLRYVTGHVMIWGESKEKTRILLMDNSSSFQKEETPLIRFLDDDFCNQAYFNGIRHITIEIGKNNPSAIAVDYVSSNNGELSDVDIICHDQQNPSLIGLNLPIRGGGLSFIHDIFIKGFKTGINVEGDYPGYTFENIRLERQLNEGIRHISKNIVIHNLTSINKCSAIRSEGSDAITTLIDAELLGGNDSETAIENEGHLFLRNIKSYGYGNVLNDKGVTFSKSFLDEYSSNVIRLSESSPAKSLSLPIKDTPYYEFPSPHKWTIFDVSEQDDDTDALQSLIDSGAEYIFIKATDECLKLRGTVRLGKKLKWIHGGWCNMDVVNEGEPGTPLFLFEDGANDLIVFEAFSNGQYRNTFTTFLNVRSKATVIRDVFMGYGDSSYRNYGTGDLFLENVVTGGGDYGHLPESKKAGWLFENQSVWFRNLNPESWVPDIHISKGARVFGIGGKLGELYGTYLRVTNGALAEMYGLMFNANMIAPYRFGLNVHGPSMTGISVEVDNADLTLVAFQDGTHSFPDPTFIKEVFGNKTFILKHDKAPERVKGRDIGVVATFYRSHYSLLNAQ